MQFSRPIGAGAFGSALAHTWHRAGRDVTLWCRDTEQASMLAGSGQNTKVPNCPPLKGIKAG
ncbi:MAG: 2-dehydropantoate 2-reductase N-terminal domain-containing protein, partial [Alphaproteobacteria bacterium]